MLAQSGGVSVSTCASKSPWGRPPPGQKDNNVLWMVGLREWVRGGEGEDGGGEWSSSDDHPSPTGALAPVELSVQREREMGLEL